jgi:hypothetical protein
MRRAGLAAALLSASLLPGCAALPPAAVGAIAGAAAAALRFDDDVLKLVVEPGDSQTLKGNPMSTIVFTIPTDAIVTVPIVFVDQVGRPIAVPAGGTVAIDNSAIAMPSLSADGGTLTITPVAVGSANVTYTNGGVSLSAGVTVITPVASAASFGQPVIAAPGS